MSFSTNSIQVESITPEKASEFLRSNFIHNRPPRKAWVEYLAREMGEGRFMSTAEIHIMYRNGEPTMVNGQHTCLAIQKFGKPVRVTVRKTNTTEQGQIAMTYAFGHDTQLRRTWTDQMGAYDLVDETGLDRTNLDKLSAALRYIKNDFGQSHVWMRPTKTGTDKVKALASPTELLDLVRVWSAEMKMFNLAVQPCETKLLESLRNRAVLSVGLITFHYVPERAFEFWNNISRPDNLTWNDARLTARKYIQETNSHDKLAIQRLSRQVARCWKAYCEGETLQLVIMPDSKVKSAIVIAGTPYNGRQVSGFIRGRSDE